MRRKGSSLYKAQKQMKKYKRVIVYEQMNIGGFLYDWCQNRNPKMLRRFEGLIGKLMILRWRHAELLNEVSVCKSRIKKVLLSVKVNLIFIGAIILFWTLSNRYKKTDYLPEELEAFTYFGVRILRVPIIHSLGIRIHTCTAAPAYEFYGIEDLRDNWIFRELFALRWAILQYYYAKCAWKRTIYRKRNIPYYKTHILGEGRRSYRQDSQKTVRMIRKRFPEQLNSKWFPIFINELIYLLEFEDKNRTAAVYRNILK